MSPLRGSSTLALGLALALALLIAGCSSTRLAYDHADILLRWRATSYLDVHGLQAEQLEANVAAFLAWHRAVALPQYARLANGAGDRLARGATRADLIWGYDSILAQARESLRAAAGRMAGLMDGLTPEQIVHLEQRFAEDNREFAREHLDGTPRERKARRVRRNVERLEEWMGALTEAQIERVEQYSGRAPYVEELRADDRARRQASLVAMLRAGEAGRRLVDWAVGWDRGRDPAYDVAARAHLEEYFDMLLDIDRMMTPEQRRGAVRRLRALAEDFALLARQASAKAVPQ